MQRDSSPEAILGELAHCNHVRWIEPEESWQSNQRRFTRTGHYVEQPCSNCGVFLQDHEQQVTPCQSFGYVPARYEYIEPDPLVAIEYSASYGDWKEIATPKEIESLSDTVLLLIEYASGSDYSGQLVEVSNHKFINEQLKAITGWEDGRDWINYSGGYGTFAVAVRVKSLLSAPQNESGSIESLLDTIIGLEDYPLADDSLHSELEIESQNEAWESWARHDFEHELSKYLAYMAESAEQFTLAEFLRNEDWVPHGRVADWFYRLADHANVYWVNEQGSDSYIDVEDVVKRGFERTLPWADIEAKRLNLLREIASAAQSGCTAAILSGEI